MFKKEDIPGSTDVSPACRKHVGHLIYDHGAMHEHIDVHALES